MRDGLDLLDLPTLAVATPRISAEGLCYRAGDTALLDRVDLALCAETPTLVMGPNGAGKSLLLRLLHGLIAPSAGRVAWNGGPLDAAARRDQAMVFQRPVLLRRSVRANMRFALRRGDPEGRGRIERLLARVGLAGHADRPARRLSGGEQQRLALARALVARPRALFLDEPTAHLDPASAQMIETLTAEAARSGVKIVFVTHDAGQARRLGAALGGEVAFLAGGQLREVTPVSAFLDRPRSAEARAYLAGRLVL